MADNQVSNGTTSKSRQKINQNTSSRNGITENSNEVERKQEDLVVLDSEEEEEEEEEEAKSIGNRNDPTNNVDDTEHEKQDTTTDLSNKDVTCKFPMNRISRIIKSEDADMRITQEAVFLINKASEKFLELFSKEAYDCVKLDGRKQVEYKHLSTVVSKRKRFDFVSDFVPEKVKAKDALEEIPSAET